MGKGRQRKTKIKRKSISIRIVKTYPNFPRFSINFSSRILFTDAFRHSILLRVVLKKKKKNLVFPVLEVFSQSVQLRQ